jgi:hydrophobe/amphiphile efflux-1 (HAE1) family protein
MASAVATPLEKQFAQISGLEMMTSQSVQGSTILTLQFSLDRNSDGAAQDVAAAINAAGGQLPKNLPNPPVYRKSNPADTPVLGLGLWSDEMPLDQVSDYIDTIFTQQLSQIPGVGQINVAGEQKPAVRVQINPTLLANTGLSLEDVRTALTNTTVNTPKGGFNGTYQASSIAANDQITKAKDYNRVVVATRNGAVVHISDLGRAVDGVENENTIAFSNSHPGILLFALRQPGANIIETVDRIKAQLPRLEAQLPKAIHAEVISDRTTTIRASVRDVETTLVITIILVIMVIFIFLRRLWATAIPAIAVPLSLIGACGVMRVFDYSLDNLSLMAMTVAVGFVVDDAIVMIENIVRHIEAGDSAYEATIKGAREIGFTIVTITFSLVAVFIPLLLMGGIIGRLFHEFAMTLSIAVLISSFVSLTLTPTMCALFLGKHEEHHSAFYRRADQFFAWLNDSYSRLLTIVLRHQRATAISLLVTIATTLFLAIVIAKGFFPPQDNGLLFVETEGPQNISFEDMARKTKQALDIVNADPGVLANGAFIGGGIDTPNSGRMFPQLKPFGQRDASAQEIVARLMPKLGQIPGIKVFMYARQDINIGTHLTKTQFQYTLQTKDLTELDRWSDVMYQKMRSLPELTAVATDKQEEGNEIRLTIDRETASRLGITPQQISDTLYDAFGQRQVQTMFTQFNQYHVILEVLPEFRRDPAALSLIYVKSSTGAQVPLSAFATFERSTAPLSVNHQGQFPAVTLSFNLAPGVALGDAIGKIKETETEVGLPMTVLASFQGNAQAFQASLTTMPYLILAAIIAVYIVLGILYESYIHPLTILSTIPSAGAGALLMLTLVGYPLDMMGLIGLILLIGIVKKNAIMMIDFALEAERRQNMAPIDAIHQAAVLRFRPIMMTTMTTLASGTTLMLAHGAGSEFRRPLGFAIVGGLMVSQALTLFTTPVVYLYLDRFGRWMRGEPPRQDAETAAELPEGAARTAAE